MYMLHISYIKNIECAEWMVLRRTYPACLIPVTGSLACLGIRLGAQETARPLATLLGGNVATFFCSS